MVVIRLRRANCDQQGEMITLQVLSILSVALLFGGMFLFASGFGSLAFKLLEKSTARSLIRNTFPYFYLYVLANSALAAILCYFVDATACLLMTIICATTLPNRQVLMPAINNAADKGDKKTWGKLHGLSVFVTLIHITLAGVALTCLL